MDVEIEQDDKLEEMWGEMGAEIMTCVAELHGSVTRMPSSILSDMGTWYGPDRLIRPSDCCKSALVSVLGSG